MATRNSNGRSGSSKGTLAVLYLRMSSDEQVESIGQQRDQLLAYAAKHGYRITAEFKDEGVSGDDTERRTGFLAMRDAAGRGEFDLVLAWDSDRIGRWDILDGGFWLRPFRQAEIRFETVAQGRIDLEDLTGQLVYSVTQMGKHQFLRDLSRNVLRGHSAAARNGKRHGTGGGGPRLYGYETQADGTVEVIPDEAGIVRRIFTEYTAQGASLRSVASGLNVEGIKTQAGRVWTISRLRKTLTNSKYLGLYVRFRWQDGKYHTLNESGEIVQRNGADKRVERDPLVSVPDNHPAIIDRAAFDQAQAKLALNQKQTARRDARVFPFRGLLRCMDCGGHMIGHGHGYLCSTYKRAGSGCCHSNQISERQLQGGVVKLLRQEYCSETRIEDLRRTLQDELAAGTAVKPVDQRRLAKRIEVLDRQLDQAAERVLVAPAAVVDRLTSKLAELQAERDRLQGELDAGEAQAQQPERLNEQTAEAAIEALQALSERLTDSTPEDLQELLSGLVVRIELHFEHPPTETGKRTRNVLTEGKIVTHMFPTTGNGWQQGIQTSS